MDLLHFVKDISQKNSFDNCFENERKNFEATKLFILMWNKHSFLV